MTKNTRRAGDMGEDIAATYLTSKGYEILERNFRAKFGEIDIVTKKGSFLVFVEVKYRSSLAFGYPYEAVDKWKLNKLKKLVDYYYLINKPTLSPKIEVLSIYKEGDESTIRHITGIIF